MAHLLKLDQKISPGTAAICGFQHVLAMFVGIITPPLIVCGALHLPPEESAYFVSMALFTSGITTFIQVRRLGPVGSGLLSVQGTSFTFVSVAMETGKAGGFPLILGMAVFCSPVAAILILFGLFPKFAAFISIMPKPVLGDATIVLFAIVAVAGFRLVASDGLNPRNEFILAITLALGLGVTLVPEAFEGIDDYITGSGLVSVLLGSLKTVLQSGLAVAGITATVLNLLLPRTETDEETD